MQQAILRALRTFADAVKARFSARAAGEPEAQLAAPVSTVIEDFGRIIHRPIVAKAESALGDRLGIPDYGILVDGALCGYLELKAPGKGADTSRYRGRNKDQWERFRSQPNILYTDGNEWGLYQLGEPGKSAYDPKLRKDSGVYYTPVEVVKCQVALVDQILRQELGKAGGFAHPRGHYP